MSRKTIGIGTDAEKRLRRARKPRESRLVKPRRVVRKPIDLEAWFAAMDRAPLSKQAVTAIARHVRDRSRRARRRVRSG